jgi:hypothetical protein
VKILSKTMLTRPSAVAHICNPRYQEIIDRRIEVQAGPGKNVRLYLKNNDSKKRWRHGSLEHLQVQSP